MKLTFDEVWEVVWAKKFTFLGIFFVVFFCTYLTFMVLDLLPEPPAAKAEQGIEASEVVSTSTASSPDVQATDESTSSTEATSQVMSAPTKLYIPTLDRSITVLNPISRSIADLDEALLEGVVRHPDSALLGQLGTVFILGHSSYLPAVGNRNFQAFNGIQNLAWGDTIELASEEVTYVYRVERVYKARAQEVVVPIAGDTERLVLATCNSFGSVDDRHIVEAELITVRSNT